MDLRNFLYDRGLFKTYHLPVPVISIGNLTVGGTGKTPLTIAIARGLQARHPNLHIGILSRGYKRTRSDDWIVSDGENILMGVEASGDEPQLMARRLPGVKIFVGADRVRIARQALSRFPLDLLILDDAYQHRRIHRDVNILLVDDHTAEHRRVLPAGPLREFPWNMKRASCLVITHDRKRIPPDLSRFCPSSIPLFKTRLILSGITEGISKAPCPPENLRNQLVWAVCGIAHPGSFLDTLSDLGVRIAGVTPFPDHHVYTRHDLEQIALQARRKNVHALITTEKDWVKWEGKHPFQRVYIVSVIPKFTEEGKFYDFIDGFVYNSRQSKK